MVLGSQFKGDRLVPNIEAVARALPRDIAFLAIANWLTAPNIDLEIKDRPVSPLRWLSAGGDPEVVAALAREL